MREMRREYKLGGGNSKRLIRMCLEPWETTALTSDDSLILLTSEFDTACKAPGEGERGIRPVKNHTSEILERFPAVDSAVDGLTNDYAQTQSSSNRRPLVYVFLWHSVSVYSVFPYFYISR